LIFFLVAGVVLCWIWDENNVDNTLMLYLLLSSVYMKSRTFSFSHCPASEEAGHAKEAGKGTQPGQLTQTGQRDIPYRMTLRWTSKLWGSWPASGGCCLGTGWPSVSRWWAIALCIPCIFYYC